MVQHGSVSGAAQHLGVAPSVVSRSIARLEQVLDMQLFERRPRGMRSSPAGELLAQHLQRTRLDFQRVVADIDALRHRPVGAVRVACTEGLARDALSVLTADFLSLHPGTRVTLDVHPPADVAQRLRAGSADIGVRFCMQAEPDLHVAVSRPAPVLAILSPDHPLRRLGAEISIAHLLPYPLALPPAGTTARQLLDISCARQGLRIEPALVANRLEPAVALVRFGQGVMLCSDVSVCELLKDGTVVAMRLRDPELNERRIEVQTLVGRSLPWACDAFLARLRRTWQDTQTDALAN